MSNFKKKNSAMREVGDLDPHLEAPPNFQQNRIQGSETIIKNLILPDWQMNNYPAPKRG
ncbi:hypothetical protein [Nostoc sp. CCY 9925]|uniref:hypothetical protein n=1 Tax=Nostoc sp. CCY 9925 TaxID=3103865 RepID=UPI0039C5F7C6